MKRLALGMAAAVAVSLAVPASATVEIHNYSFTTSGLADGDVTGTYTLGVDTVTSALTLEHLNLTVQGLTFDATNASVFGTLSFYYVGANANGGADSYVFNSGDFYLAVGSNNYREFAAPNGQTTNRVTLTELGAVPEPATWAMMLLGIGMIGAGARHRRQRQTLSPALS